MAALFAFSRVFRPGEPNCPSCSQILAGDEMQTEGLVRCSRCRTEILFHAFPALIRDRTPIRAGEKLANTEDASCYYHLDKVAELTCDSCGRFICGLCDLEIAGRHLCPVCFQANLSKGDNVRVERRRMLKDSVALWTAILPIFLFWPVTIITGPTAVFMALRYWKAPTSVVGRTKTRLILAILLGLAETGLWAMFFITLFNL